MRFVVLTSKPDSPYADTSMSYEYPARYRKQFAPLDSNEPMLAIIYGPADEAGRRMAYIGWAALKGQASRSPRNTARGEPQWEVQYVEPIQYFPNPIPFRYLGEAMEGWVRDWPDGTPDMRGRSVRGLSGDDARRILELAYAGSLSVEDYAQPTGDATLLVAERSRRLVEAVTRDARFRRDVMSAYGFICAVTGLTAGTSAPRRAARLLDAAHIRPVGDMGPDLVINGLSLTPTVHRLFDEGLISIKWTDRALELVTSPRLESQMIEAPERGTTIRLLSGTPLILPGDRESWPQRDLVRYHQNKVFKGPESLVS
jgi:putative restriction endonuclease